VATAITVVLIERGYAKAIYQGVKKLVLNIEIDEEKKQQQVAAITETESFAELQQKAAELRKNRRRNREVDNASESGKEPDEIIPIREEAEPIEIEKNEVTPTPQDAEVPAAEEDDYLKQLQKRGRRLRKNDQDSNE
jgi:hypothetical protein